MQTYIALLRGINVGGHHKLPMKELRTLLENLGLQNVRTYIQSGNVVFQSQEKDRSRLARQISADIKKDHGFEPDVQLLTAEEMEKAIQSNPFPEGEPEPKSLHLFFLAAVPPKPNLEAIDALRTENERFALIDKVFYLHAPDGIGRSRLVEKFGRYIDVSMTARNWRTVSKIMEMVREIG
jgi:uncharacterized protein (DUF1697 family)